jgi:hypothetical protein
MKQECEIRDELVAAKDAAFTEWYEARNQYEAVIAQGDVARSSTARLKAEAPERKAHNLQRALGAHCSQHGCNRGS